MRILPFGNANDSLQLQQSVLRRILREVWESETREPEKEKIEKGQGMGWKTVIKPEDSIFSELVRTLAGWKCVRCGRQHEIKQNTLDCSHYFGRNHKSVRFDLDNADALCRYPCHQGSDSTNPERFGWEYQKGIGGFKNWSADGEYTLYKKKQLGEQRFSALIIRSEGICKMTSFDIKELRKSLREMLQKAKGGIL